MMERTFQDKMFDTFVVVFLAVVVILCILPIIHITAISLSSNEAIVAAKVSLFPVNFNINPYKSVFGNESMVRSLIFTIILTAIYTIISMFMTICAAYPLTKTTLKGRTFFMVLIVITMYFTGGMIPEYILVKKLGLLNTMGALILPGMISAFNMIILKSFFESLPASLEESAHIDGYSYIGILFKIVLPLSTPVLATLCLLYAVTRWNTLQDALLYITDPKLFTIQLKLYHIVMNSMVNDLVAKEGGNAVQLVPESLKAASIMVGTLPILLLYPYMQKYFMSGIMVGAVKG